MCRRLLIAVAFLCGVTVALSDAGAARRRQVKEIKASSSAEYVDMGIRLVIVERDPNGRPIVPGNAQKMRTVGDTIDVGGIVKIWTDSDGNRRAHVVRKSNNPQVWYASQAQADLIVHDGPVPSVLVQGSEGSGKTTVLVMWTAWRVVDNIGRDCEGGITAPTGPRLNVVFKELRKKWRRSWFHYSARDKLFSFHALPKVQMVSAVQKSEEAGSPLQGANWHFCGSDEFQDHFSVNDDIMARGRTAEAAGVDYKRLCTSTFKDSPDWRTFRSVADKATIPVNDNEPDGAQRQLWHLVKLFGLESPFIPASHWQKMRAGLTDREYRRRVLAEDVGPERQLYYSWRRTVANDNGRTEPGNVRQLPIGAVDVTARELSRFGQNIGLLLGNDPGKRQHVTEVLKAYEFPGERRSDLHGRPLPPIVRWFVVDEITSDIVSAEHPSIVPGPVTIEVHVTKVLERVRSKWRCMLRDSYTGGISPNSPRVLVRIDPHDTSGETHPGRVVKTQWKNAGFIALDAAYNDKQKPTPIKVEDRVDMLLTLLCNVDNERRLYVLADDRGEPVAPKLVSAFETMERNEKGKAEWEDKTAADKSHWPASVSFALWVIEKPRIDEARRRAA